MPAPLRSMAYQRAIKEANEWTEAAQSADEPVHDLDPVAALPRLEFMGEPRVAAASKLLNLGGSAGGAATHASSASLPQPSFRLARCIEPVGRRATPTKASRLDHSWQWAGSSRGLRRPWHFV